MHTRKNTDGNKLVIFSGIALHYGDSMQYCMVCTVQYFKQVAKIATYLQHEGSCALSNSRECIGVNEEALQLHAVYFLLQVTCAVSELALSKAAQSEFMIS